MADGVGLVALFVSAWIETLLFCSADAAQLVALFVSAWIETKVSTENEIYRESHSS